MALTDNLVAYYKLDGNSNDSVGSNNGTDSGITYNSSYGKIGQGASGSGTSYTSIPHQTAFNLQSSFSIFSWVYLTSYGKASSYEGVIVSKDDLATNRSFRFIIRGPADSSNNGKLFFFHNPATATYVLSTGKVELNGWHHVGIVSTQGTYTFYIDGLATGTGSTNITPVSQGTAPLSLRSINNITYLESLIGYQDEVGIWSRALSAGEVTQLYNSGVGLQYPFTTDKPSLFPFFNQYL